MYLSIVVDVFTIWFPGDCGVIHLHDNRRVVAASRAEDHVSRCAVQDVFELHQNSQDPALNCDPLSDVGGLLTDWHIQAWTDSCLFADPIFKYSFMNENTCSCTVFYSNFTDDC